MQLHFSYSIDNKTIALTYDESISLVFRSAQTICRDLLSKPTSKASCRFREKGRELGKRVGLPHNVVRPAAVSLS